MDMNNNENVVISSEVPDELVIESNFDTTDNKQAQGDKPKKQPKAKRVRNVNVLKIALIIIVVFIAGGIGYFVVTNLTAKTYTISFDTDGGTVVKSITVKSGKKCKKPSDPIKAGYSFISWKLDDKDYNFNNSVNKDIKLKAAWEIALTEDIYDVVFDSMGGTEVPEQIINGNGKVVKPQDPIKEHFIFEDWLYNGEPYDFDTLVNEDMTLNASYREVGKFTVSFDTDGGNELEDEIVYEGQKFNSPAAPTKYGYKFTGWLLYGEPYTFLDDITEDITLVATWEKLPTHTVTFDTDGGSVIASQEIVDDTKLSKPSNPTKYGYSFDKWKLNGSDYDFNKKVKSDITLKATWKETSVKKCVVGVYDIQDSNISLGSKEINCGSKISKEDLTPLVRAKYATGDINWLTKGFGDFDFSSPINDNVGVYVSVDS